MFLGTKSWNWSARISQESCEVWFCLLGIAHCVSNLKACLGGSWIYPSLKIHFGSKQLETGFVNFVPVAWKSDLLWTSHLRNWQCWRKCLQGEAQTASHLSASSWLPWYTTQNRNIFGWPPFLRTLLAFGQSSGVPTQSKIRSKSFPASTWTTNKYAIGSNVLFSTKIACRTMNLRIEKQQNPLLPFCRCRAC